MKVESTKSEIKNENPNIANAVLGAVLLTNSNRMSKVIRKVFKIDTLSLHECNDGYYLYDYVIGMNISMRAKTEQDAYIEALLYYQKKLTEVKNNYIVLNNKVQNFISQFAEDEEV